MKIHSGICPPCLTSHFKLFSNSLQPSPSQENKTMDPTHCLASIFPKLTQLTFPSTLWSLSRDTLRALPVGFLGYPPKWDPPPEGCTPQPSRSPNRYCGSTLGGSTLAPSTLRRTSPHVLWGPVPVTYLVCAGALSLPRSGCVGLGSLLQKKLFSGRTRSVPWSDQPCSPAKSFPAWLAKTDLQNKPYNHAVVVQPVRFIRPARCWGDNSFPACTQIAGEHPSL